MNTYLLMSIKTKHAKQIFSGEKIYEYRTKSIGEDNLNKYCFIYSSKEDKKVIGYVIFDEIISGDLKYIIEKTKPSDEKLLLNYFKDKKKCYALHIKEYKLFDNPIDIKRTKECSIPQYYRYINKNEKLYNEIKKYIPVYEMNLQDKFFNYIKYGTKRLEIRLNDEKRSIIKIGDSVNFVNLSTGEIVRTRVINKHNFNNFEELLNKFNIEYVGDKSLTKEFILDSLNNIYDKTKQQKYGVLGMEIELIENI